MVAAPCSVMSSYSCSSIASGRVNTLPPGLNSLDGWCRGVDSTMALALFNMGWALGPPEVGLVMLAVLATPAVVKLGLRLDTLDELGTRELVVPALELGTRGVPSPLRLRPWGPESLRKLRMMLFSFSFSSPSFRAFTQPNPVPRPRDATPRVEAGGEGRFGPAILIGLRPLGSFAGGGVGEPGPAGNKGGSPGSSRGKTSNGGLVLDLRGGFLTVLSWSSASLGSTGERPLENEPTFFQKGSFDRRWVRVGAWSSGELV
ncbi:hypothetical protein AG1IA_09907 [Rhizoctonia solani AG-1 IA]|uniref:Uncharacterized protein n=1 Tax=Thanatephorus cucumeris (strain AG1-IA) TaxID=983506 RepID=L8WH07_THACA|nr:hypothetical protein AG1IA_09907 [Rhizoctonia solani AG-1 IA]